MVRPADRQASAICTACSMPKPTASPIGESPGGDQLPALFRTGKKTAASGRHHDPRLCVQCHHRERRGYASPEEVLRTAMHFQQVTGPVLAKACEDTAFYRYF